MTQAQLQKNIRVLDVHEFTYAERLCAAVLQGLVNRTRPLIFLDYGYYDDPGARRTNEIFLDDQIWYGKFRAMLGNQDQRNLTYYRERFSLSVESIPDLKHLISQFREVVTGLVIWDEELADTANIALMLSAQENLLPVIRALADELSEFDLPVIHDLQGRWKDRVELYTWALNNLFDRCKPGIIASIEPGWQHPEFIDYIVQQKIFTYSLSSHSKGTGDNLLLLLAFGPPWLRELIFAVKLDGLIRKFSLFMMGVKSEEVKLSNLIQRSVITKGYPTIFGWHTCRDNELSFMLQLSSNGLRLVPSHLASNFSFQSQLPSDITPRESHINKLFLDPQGIYITFTLSDGDQLMMMNTAELGNWYSSARGSVPFNWEVQPLLAEIAPALLEKYISNATEKDCLIAGPSGAGYVVPPLVPNLKTYMEETARLCALTGVEVVTTYVADPPQRVLNNLVKNKGSLLGYLSGYAVIKRAPQKLVNGTPIISNNFPKVDQIWYPADDLLNEIKQEILKERQRPRFIGVHLFAYRTTIDDIAKFIETNKDTHVHFVRADDFLLLSNEYLRRKPDGK